jgi:hypothetical protein
VRKARVASGEAPQYVSPKFRRKFMCLLGPNHRKLFGQDGENWVNILSKRRYQRHTFLVLPPTASFGEVQQWIHSYVPRINRNG